MIYIFNKLYLKHSKLVQFYETVRFLKYKCHKSLKSTGNSKSLTPNDIFVKVCVRITFVAQKTTCRGSHHEKTQTHQNALVVRESEPSYFNSVFDGINPNSLPPFREISAVSVDERFKRTPNGGGSHKKPVGIGIIATLRPLRYRTISPKAYSRTGQRQIVRFVLLFTAVVFHEPIRRQNNTRPKCTTGFEPTACNDIVNITLYRRPNPASRPQSNRRVGFHFPQQALRPPKAIVSDNDEDEAKVPIVRFYDAHIFTRPIAFRCVSTIPAPSSSLVRRKEKNPRE